MQAENLCGVAGFVNALLGDRAFGYLFPIVDGGGAGRATGAAGESERRRFWTALATESWLFGTESSASLIRRL